MDTNNSPDYLEFEDRKSALFLLWNCKNLNVLTYYNKKNQINS